MYKVGYKWDCEEIVEIYETAMDIAWNMAIKQADEDQVNQNELESWGREGFLSGVCPVWDEGNDWPLVIPI